MPRYANAPACCAVRHSAVTQTPRSTRQTENATIRRHERERAALDVQVEDDDARRQEHDELHDGDDDARHRLAHDDLERGRAGSRGGGPRSPNRARRRTRTSRATRRRTPTSPPGRARPARRRWRARSRAATSAGRNAGFRNAVVMIGNTSSTRIENGSRRARRDSCATITPSRRSRVHAADSTSVRVALPGERREHRLERGPDDLDRRECRRRPRRARPARARRWRRDRRSGS